MRSRPRRAVLALAALALVLVAARLALEPLAAWRTRRTLAALEGMHGTFAGVELDLRRPSYAIRRLRIDKVVDGGRRTPYVEAEQVTVRFEWRELLRGRLVSSLDVDTPTLHVVQRPRARPVAEPGEPQRIAEAPRRGSGLERLAPLGVDRAQVRRGRVLLAEARDPATPVLRLRDVELAMEGLGARRRPGRERPPAVLTGSATLQRTGKISVFATADVLAARPTFAGRGQLTGLRFEELRALVAGKSDVAPSQGVLDMVVGFQGIAGRISGDVRPILSGAGTLAAEPGIAAKLRSMVADGSLDVFREDVPGGADPAATTIPMVGTVKDPGAHPMAIVVGVLRNAFVVGLSAVFHGPPPRATNDRTREQARKGAREGAASRRRTDGRDRGR